MCYVSLGKDSAIVIKTRDVQSPDTTHGPIPTDWPVLYLSAARLQFEIIVERNYDEVDSNFTIPGY